MPIQSAQVYSHTSIFRSQENDYELTGLTLKLLVQTSQCLNPQLPSGKLPEDCSPNNICIYIPRVGLTCIGFACMVGHVGVGRHVGVG